MNRKQIVRTVQLVFVAVAALTLAGHAEAAGALTSKSTNSKSVIVRVEKLHPFTHFAYIPQGVNTWISNTARIARRKNVN